MTPSIFKKLWFSLLLPGILFYCRNSQRAARFQRESWSFETAACCHQTTCASSEWTQVYGHLVPTTNILFRLQRLHMVCNFFQSLGACYFVYDSILLHLNWFLGDCCGHKVTSVKVSELVVKSKVARTTGVVLLQIVAEATVFNFCSIMETLLNLSKLLFCV